MAFRDDYVNLVKKVWIKYNFSSNKFGWHQVRLYACIFMNHMYSVSNKEDIRFYTDFWLADKNFSKNNSFLYHMVDELINYSCIYNLYLDKDFLFTTDILEAMFDIIQLEKQQNEY